MKGASFFLVCLLFSCIYLHAETFRAVVDGSIEISPERPAGNSVTVGINSSVIISLNAQTRFLRGIEIEINAPQTWLQYRGALVMSVHNNISPKSASGIADITGTQISLEPLPSRLQIIYQLPIRQNHGLRTTTSVTALNSTALPSTFPILFSFMPAIKGVSFELENLTFNFTARPIFSDEGAVKIITRFPAQLKDKPFTVLIDDNVISNISEEIVLREGEHHLVIRSDDYRNESRRFVVERTKVVELTVELQDPAPILIFEGPQNAVIFLNNNQIQNTPGPVTVEPGMHEIKYQIGNYTVTQTLNVQRGKTYRVALNLDLTIQEEEL